jgi:hypothetical protein
MFPELGVLNARLNIHLLFMSLSVFATRRFATKAALIVKVKLRFFGGGQVTHCH